MRLNIVRHIVQCLIIVLFLSPLIAESFLGILPSDWFFFGTLSSSTILGSVVIVDPFVALQSIAASKQLPAASLIIGSVTILVLYLLIRGRVFCGWVCPANLIFEIVEFCARPLHRWLRNQERQIARKTRDGKPRARLASALSRRVKIIVAAGVLVLCALCGIPVFELISPIGATFRGLVMGAWVGIWVLLALVVLEIFYPGRIWCRKLCPLGGFYEFIGRLGFFSVKIKPGCTKCDKCKIVCLCDPSVLNPVIQGSDVVVRAGDCMLCGKCVKACPDDLLSIKPVLPLGLPKQQSK
ncbi:MAG: 4Fe-4S binding protein [Coriobacteriia bacterium]|nr:4Fe-4S binding protein [Coriobacteriia bacterium]